MLCAGVLFTRAEWTEETLERGFVLNYLSRYLVLRRLLPLLSPAPSARVVLVANAGRYRDTLDMNDLQLRRGGRGLRIAGRIQFANDLLGVALAERVHAEGILVATDVFRNARGAARPVRTVAAALQRLLGTPPAVAAQTPVVLVTDPDPAGLNGAVGVSLAVRYAGTDARHSGPPARPSSLPGRQPLLPLLALCETTGRS